MFKNLWVPVGKIFIVSRDFSSMMPVGGNSEAICVALSIKFHWSKTHCDVYYTLRHKFSYKI